MGVNFSIVLNDVKILRSRDHSNQEMIGHRNLKDVYL